MFGNFVKKKTRFFPVNDGKIIISGYYPTKNAVNTTSTLAKLTP